VSEFDEPDLHDLERELDAAFASTRPRRGFDDELWRRLQARRPWWRRVRLPVSRALAALGGLAAVVLVGFLIVTVVNGGALRSSQGAAGSAAQRTSAGPASLQFGLLPRPSPVAVAPPSGGGFSPALRPTGAGEGVSAVPPRLPVYRYAASTGPPNGTVLDQNSVPPGLESAEYPTRQPSEALQRAAASAAQSQASEAALTQARLVYVAVTDGSVGYLVPEYELSGTAKVAGTATPFTTRVPALADSAFR